MFNFRFSTAQTDEGLRAAVHEVFDRHAESYEINWRTSGQPFLTPVGELVGAVRDSITDVTGLGYRVVYNRGHVRRAVHRPDRRTGRWNWGPSMPRFIKSTSAFAADLDVLSKLYEGTLQRLLA